MTQVMPSALLDMSRNVLRRCFTCPLLPKRVYTLGFDRSVDDSAELVEARLLVVRAIAGEDPAAMMVVMAEANRPERSLQAAHSMTTLMTTCRSRR